MIDLQIHKFIYVLYTTCTRFSTGSCGRDQASADTCTGTGIPVISKNALASIDSRVPVVSHLENCIDIVKLTDLIVNFVKLIHIPVFPRMHCTCVVVSVSFFINQGQEATHKHKRNSFAHSQKH